MSPDGENEFQYTAQPPVGGDGGQNLPETELPVDPNIDRHKNDNLDQEMMRWEASEFIDHQKNPIWFVGLAAATVVACVAVFFLTGRNILATVVVAVAAVAFGVLAGKRPRTLVYTLMPTTLKIGEKSYSYDDFRTFSLSGEGGLSSVVLQPMKRFMPPITIYYDSADGQKIFDILASHIPHEEKKEDSIDRFMGKIRF